MPEHTLDVAGVDFDDKVADSDQVEPERAECPVESVELELGLRETGFAFIEGYRAEAVVVADFRVVDVLLGEVVAHGDVGGVDG